MEIISTHRHARRGGAAAQTGLWKVRSVIRFARCGYGVPAHDTKGLLLAVKRMQPAGRGGFRPGPARREACMPDRKRLQKIMVISGVKLLCFGSIIFGVDSGVDKLSKHRKNNLFNFLVDKLYTLVVYFVHEVIQRADKTLLFDKSGAFGPVL
jgi:hypothetical protein